MRFRQVFFWVLAALAFLWLVVGLSASADVTGRQLQSTEARSSAGFQAGTVIGGGIASSIVLCTGLPAFVVFALLAWRNGVGLRTERHHREQLEAQREQAHALNVGAAAQVAQFQQQQARQQAVPAISASAVPRERLSRAWQLYHAGELEQARAIVTPLYKTYPNDADVLYMVSFVADSREKQIAAAQRAAAIDPNHAKARERLVELNASDDLL